MADELQILPEPLAVPAAVLTCYTRQNTNAEAARNGLDLSAPYGTDTDEVTLPIGGPVDINGVLFSIYTPATLSGIAADTDYYIYLAAGSTSDEKTPTLTTNAGTFDASKNARYTAGGDRILNWKLRGDGVANVVCTRIINPRDEDSVIDQGLRQTDSPTFDGVKTDNVVLKTKIVELGDWNMVSTPTLRLYEGPSVIEDYSKIRGIQVLIRSDNGNNLFPLDYDPGAGASGSVQVRVGDGEIWLVSAPTPGIFDNTNYDATGYNRGWITILYEA